MVMVSLGMTADLIGEETSSSALVFGLMSLTDKVGFGWAKRRRIFLVIVATKLVVLSHLSNLKLVALFT